MNGKDKIVWEIVICIVVIGGLVSATIAELNVNGNTEYRNFYKSTSFWLLVIAIFTIITYFILKKILTDKIESFLNEKVSLIETNITSNIKSSINNDISAANRSYNRNLKHEIKQSFDAKIENYFLNTVLPKTDQLVNSKIDAFKKDDLNNCLHTMFTPTMQEYVRHEIEKIAFEEKIELFLYRQSKQSQASNEQLFDVNKLAVMISEKIKSER